MHSPLFPPLVVWAGGIGQQVEECVVVSIDFNRPLRTQKKMPGGFTLVAKHFYKPFFCVFFMAVEKERDR